MLFNKFNRKKCRLVDEAVFDYLYSENAMPSKSHFEHSLPIQEQRLFQQSQLQQIAVVPPKLKKQRQIITRICFKNLSFQDIAISKHSIALSVTKRRQPDLQISFVLEGKKEKLSIPPSKDNISIHITLSSCLLQMSAKNAFHLEYGGQGDKQKWVLKHSYLNSKIRANYHPKKYDQSVLQMFFRANSISYFIVDPAMKQQKKPQASLQKEMEMVVFTQPEQAQFPFVQFPLPFDPQVDQPIRMLLSHIEDPSLMGNNQQHYKQSGTKVANEVSIDNRDETKPEAEQESRMQDKQYQVEQHYEEEVSLQANFKQPSKQELEDTQQERLDILNLEIKEKKQLINDVLQIKKFKKSHYSIEANKMPCPVNSCRLVAKHPDQLRVHLYNSHRQLSKYGIKVDAQGRLKYSQKAMNFVLYVAKLYPSEVKKIIKRMKLKQ